MTNKKIGNRPNVFFPFNTLDAMIRMTIGNDKVDDIRKKLEEIKTFVDLGKANRWFGYYQAMGENRGLWTLEMIIDLVRREKDKKLKMD